MALTKNPPSLATGRVSKLVVGLESTADEIAKDFREVHEIRVARVVAGLAFEEVRA